MTAISDKLLPLLVGVGGGILVIISYILSKNDFKKKHVGVLIGGFSMIFEGLGYVLEKPYEYPFLILGYVLLIVALATEAHLRKKYRNVKNI